MSSRAFCGLGSNVGDRLENIKRAVELLGATPGLEVAAVSSVYETEPVGPPQPDFLNVVVEVATDLGPRELVGRLKAVESDVGRTPGERWGPREIDLDLLLHGDERVDAEDIEVPHPRLAERAFVLVPLAELAPDLVVPGAGRTVAELLDEAGRAGVRRVHGPDALLG